MRLAVEEMRKSSGRGPKVGAVIANAEGVISVGHRVVGTHGEQAAIETALATGADLRGATLFSTLEPCVSTNANRESCAELICRVGIQTVYVGRYDTNPNIYREGWKILRAAGISVKDFLLEYRSEIDSINAQFTDHFVQGTGPSGGAKFDYQLNGGNFEIQFSDNDERTIVTRWVNRGANSIYAYAVQPVRVALARYAAAFDEIDDPRAFDFTYTVPVDVEEIAVFVSDVGAVLVKVKEVEAGPAGGAAQRYVKIEFEVRAW